MSSSVCTIQGVTPFSLTHALNFWWIGHFPDLAKQLAARHKQRRLETAKISRAGNLAQIREAARILREKGERITQRAIKGLLPTPSIMANDWARAAAKAEVKA